MRQSETGKNARSRPSSVSGLRAKSINKVLNRTPFPAWSLARARYAGQV